MNVPSHGRSAAREQGARRCNWVRHHSRAVTVAPDPKPASRTPSHAARPHRGRRRRLQRGSTEAFGEGGTAEHVDVDEGGTRNGRHTVRSAPPRGRFRRNEGGAARRPLTGSLRAAQPRGHGSPENRTPRPAGSSTVSWGSRRGAREGQRAAGGEIYRAAAASLPVHSTGMHGQHGGRTRQHLLPYYTIG